LAAATGTAEEFGGSWQGVEVLLVRDVLEEWLGHIGDWRRLLGHIGDWRDG
jgi:hypothetical protein